MSRNLDSLNFIESIHNSPGDPEGARNNLKQKILLNKKHLIISAKLIKVMSSMDMDAEARDYFNRNKEVILENLKVARESHKELSPSPSSPSSSEGCYIATMAYGDYDHPQVLALRKFRDRILKHSFLGRIFIILYYRISPFMVKKLKDKAEINIKIRELLDKFIYKIIKK
jgi:hypothetical protein|tara:strand:+ start:2009 stop:2521 length:513 start_codon:yes stop_codon:yes gene_type:complete